MHFLVDTGSQVSTLSLDTPQTLVWAETDLQLQSASGTDIPVYGSVYTTVGLLR